MKNEAISNQQTAFSLQQSAFGYSFDRVHLYQRGSMKDFRNLKVWEKSHLLTMSIYRVTSTFPKEELYGLTSQIRRSCTSIPTNISEGCGRGSNAEFGRFLQIAMGSACELEYQILLSHDLGFIADPDYKSTAEQLVQVKQKLASLISKVKSES